jgi:hypothetical protein
MTSSTVSRNLCHERRGGRAAQQELGRLLTLDPASYPTGLEGGILPPSLLLPASLPGFPAERGEPCLRRGHRDQLTIRSTPSPAGPNGPTATSNLESGRRRSRGAAQTSPSAWDPMGSVGEIRCERRHKGSIDANAGLQVPCNPASSSERATGFEPATSSLHRREDVLTMYMDEVTLPRG